jgi:uncharacterized protein YqhQ
MPEHSPDPTDDAGAAAPVSRHHQHRAPYYGGQAVIEGVMMRGARMWAVAVRRPSGEVYLERHPVSEVPQRHPLLQRPMLRGVWALVDALSIGTRALTISANQSVDDDEQLSKKGMGGSLLVALGLFIVIFIAVPNAGLAWLLQPIDSELVYHVVEGLVRVAMFLGYLALIALMRDIQRVFAYHGGEHKTIAAWEHHERLVPDRIQRYSTVHVRCGTNFLMMVMVVSIFVYSVFGALVPPPEWVCWFGYASYHIGLRILLLPVVAGIAYESLRLGASDDSLATRLVMRPGLWLQKITTKPPDDSMVEVAIRAFQAVVPAADLGGRTVALPAPVVWGPDEAPADLYAKVGQPGDVTQPTDAPDGLRAPSRGSASYSHRSAGDP